MTKATNIKLYNIIKLYNTIQSLATENELIIWELNINNEDDKHQLYSMSVTYNCVGCPAALLTQYRNNETYQEITKEADYFKDTSDKKLYVGMRKVDTR